MVTSLSMRSNQTSKNTSQEELRDLMGKSPAAHRFLTLFKTPLDQFVGNIIEVFKAPKAEGVDFEFMPGKRTEFPEPGRSFHDHWQHRPVHVQQPRQWQDCPR